MGDLEELLIAARSPQVEVRANAGRDLVAHLGDARADAAGADYLLRWIEDA